VLVGVEGAAEVADRGRFADAWLAGEDPEARLGGEPAEGAREPLIVRVALEEALARGAAGERRVVHAEALAPGHGMSSGSDDESSPSPKARSSAWYSSSM
jgi:hypothetical protein